MQSPHFLPKNVIILIVGLIISAFLWSAPLFWGSSLYQALAIMAVVLIGFTCWASCSTIYLPAFFAAGIFVHSLIFYIANKLLKNERSFKYTLGFMLISAISLTIALYLIPPEIQ